MTAEFGIILGLGIALVLFILVRRVDRKQHERKMKVLQDRIERSERAAADRREAGKPGDDA